MINAWTEFFLKKLYWAGLFPPRRLTGTATPEQREVMRQISEETEEDLQELVKIFKQASVQVALKKTLTINGEEQVKLPGWNVVIPNCYAVIHYSSWQYNV